VAHIDIDVTLGQRYRLVRRIAAGGMGSVWEAEDTVLHRRVAVKVLSDGLAADERFAERFRTEARAAAGLSHANVAGVFDYGVDDGSQFMVMELIEGGTLADRLAGGPLQPEEAVRIAVEIAHALQAAHDAGIVHRDVKPGNVMLTSSGDVKVMDFGIAAAAWAAPLTTTGHTMGTATYLSPEQAQGERATPRSDVYSLGVVLYEMLAGRPPFAGDSAVAVAAAHAHERPPPLGEWAPGAPAHVLAACERALAKDPADRPASAAAFAAMLGPGEGVTEVLPTEATSVLPAVRGGPPVRALARAWRGPLLVLAVVAGLILLTVILAGALGGELRPTPPRVAVPGVIGQSQDDAVAALEVAGLKGEVQTVEGEPGIVVDSDPPPGASVRAGSTVTLFVGATPQGEQGDDHPGKGKGKGDGGGD
jgi:predicted Ser/Thr protein kinase